MATRGAMAKKPEGRKHKPDMVGKKSKEVFTGVMNRDYKNFPKYSVKPVNKLGFTTQGKMSKKMLEAKYPDAIIKPLKG